MKLQERGLRKKPVFDCWGSQSGWQWPEMDRTHLAGPDAIHSLIYQKPALCQPPSLMSTTPRLPEA